MKKVVLLAGAVAAGMAVAPQAANAAIPEINDVQEINLTNDQINASITKATEERNALAALQTRPYYETAVSASDKTAIQNAVDDLTALITQLTSLVGGSNSYFRTTDQTTYPYYQKGTLTVNPSASTTPQFIRRYAGRLSYSYGTRSTCNDVVDAAISRVSSAKTSAAAAIAVKIQQANTDVQTDVKGTSEYTHLEAVLKEAQDILDGNNDLYAHEDTYKDLKEAHFDAHLKDGAMKSAQNLINKIEEIHKIDNEVISKEELMIDLGIVSPELEGLINTFKIAANKAAYDKIAEYVDGFTHVKGGDSDPVEDGKLTKIKKELQHHLETSANCLNKETHNIFDDASDVTAAENALADLLAGFEPDKDWNNMGHNATNPDSDLDRALNDPKAVKKWKEIQDQMVNTNWEDKTNPVDVQLTEIRTIIYQTCLAWDKADINDAITELSTGEKYLGHSENFKGDSVTVKAEESNTGSEKTVTVESELKQWLTDFLTKYPAADNADTKGASTASNPYIEGSIADKYWDRFHDGTTTDGTVAQYMKGNASVVTPTNFADAEAAVNVLANTIANVKANWDDFVTLDNNLVARRLEMEAAAEKKGYDSGYIAGLWGTKTSGTDVRDITIATEGEWNHHEKLRKDIKKAINDIKDTAASVTNNAGAWVGVGEETDPTSFAGMNALEEDHHKWLAQYQLENYQAKEDMLDAIDVRFAEYQKVATFAITSDDPKNPMKLADETELYTTNTNKDVQLQNILGEDNTSANIYKDKFFAEIAEHFGNGDNTVDTASPIVKDGKPVDLKNDLITKWYNDGEAQYIVKQTYDAAWNAEGAARYGKLKDNTVEGLQVNTTAADASGILVMNPTVTTSDNKEIFGWLQKEIQNAFKKAVENEIANKDIHDKIKEANDYIAAGKKLINEKANIKVTDTDVSACDYTTYDMENRKDVTVSESAYTADNWLNFKGEYQGDKANNYKVTADLNADYYGKEEYSLGLTTYSIDYLAEFNCGHNATETPNDKVWGWTKLEKVMADLETLEKQEYDKVASKALFDGTTPMDLDSDGTNETFTGTLTEVKENVDDITNEAFTQLYKNGLALVQEELNKAKTWAKSLDDKCHEDPALDTACSAEDVKNNPCGWDDTTATGDAHDLLKAIVEAWNKERELIVSDHNAEANDTYDTTSDPNVKKVDDFNAYLIGALNAIRDWKAKFAEMDKAHKIALNAALDEATSAATTGRTFAEIAKLDKASFTDADKAVAELWAKDFNTRSFTFLDNTAYTFTELLAKLEANIKKAHNHVDEPLDDDKYKELERVIADGIATFDDYIYATEIIDQLCVEYATALHKAHSYTELKTFSEGLKKFNLVSDYMKAINANNAAYVELQKKLGDAQTELNAAKNNVETDKNEVYLEDYTALTTTHLQDAQKVLDDQQKAIKEAWLAGKAADHIEVVKDVRTEVKGYALDLTKDGKDVIKAYVDKAQEAKNLYATNKQTKDDLLVQIQAILTSTNAAYAEADCAIAEGCNAGVKTDLDDLKKALVGEDGTAGVKKEVTDGFDNKFATMTAAQLKEKIDLLETTLGHVKKTIADFNDKVNASQRTQEEIFRMLDELNPVIAEVKALDGADKFKQDKATLDAFDIRNDEVLYFCEIEQKITDFKAEVENANSHKGKHTAFENRLKYLKKIAEISNDIEDLEEAIEANNKAYKEQMEEYNAVEKGYDCYKTVVEGTTTTVKFAANEISDPDFTGTKDYDEADDTTYDHSENFDKDVQTALDAYMAAINKYFNQGASAVEDAQKKISNETEGEDPGFKQKYLNTLNAAKANDRKFVALFDNLNRSVLENLACDWSESVYVNEWPVGDVNSYSNAANADVDAAYIDLRDAVDAYLWQIKTDWKAKTVVAQAEANAYATLVQDYNDALAAYNKAKADAKSNDTELLTELEMLGDKVELLTDLHKEHPETSDVLTAMRTQLAKYKAYCDTYADIKAKIVQDWEEEMLVVEEGKELSTTVAGNRAAAQKYRDWADKHNKLVAAINAYCADLEQIDAKQAALDKVETDIKALEIYNEKLNIDDVDVIDDKHPYGYDEDRKPLLDKLDRIQGLIDDLQTAADTEASTVKGLICDDADKTNDRLYVDKVVDKDEVKSATATLWEDAQKEENLFKENENAFDSVYAAYTFKYNDKEGTEVSVSYADGLHYTMLETKDKATKYTAYDIDRKGLTGLAFEAFYKFVNTSIKDENGEVIVKSLVEQLDDEINALVTLYKAENAASFDVKKYEELKNKIDYARSVAEGVGENLGDVTANHNTTGDLINEFDFMYLLEEKILKAEKPSTTNPAENRGDLNLDGKYDITDLQLLDNLIWYKNLDGVQRAQANRGEFEAEFSADVIGNTVAIAIENNYEFKGLQFDVTVPAGARITDLIATTRAQGLIVASNKYAEDTYRVVIIGMGGDKMITGNDGNVLSFNVRGAEGEVEIFNVTAANGISYDLGAASLYIGQTTDIDEVAAEGETDIFSLDGIRQSVMKAGVNIVRGANGVAKKIFNK